MAGYAACIIAARTSSSSTAVYRSVVATRTSSRAGLTARRFRLPPGRRVWQSVAQVGGQVPGMASAQSSPTRQGEGGRRLCREQPSASAGAGVCQWGRSMMSASSSAMGMTWTLPPCRVRAAWRRGRRLRGRRCARSRSRLSVVRFGAQTQHEQGFAGPWWRSLG